MKKLFIVLVVILSASMNAQNVKEEKVETSYLEYPRISVKDMDMNNLTVEFAHSNPVIKETIMVKGANLCKPKNGSIKDAKAIETYYYNVHYTSPDGILRIAGPDNKILYMTYTSKNSDATDEYAKDKCYFLPAILESAYKKEKDAYLATLTEKESKEMLNNAQTFVNKSLTFSYTPETVEVHYVKTNKDYDYSDTENAMQQAVAGYGHIKDNYNSSEGRSKLESAVQAWEKILTELNTDDKKARIDKKVASNLYENAAIACLYLQQYDKALKLIQASLDLYPNITTNATMFRENVRNNIMEQKRYHDMNSDVGVAFSETHPTVVNLGNDAIDKFKADYNDFAGDEMKNKIAAAKEAYDEGIASGDINPYQAKVTQTATQGYMLVLPSLTGNITSLEEMQAAMKKLDEFPIEVCDLTQLNQLIIKNNHIKTIPADIKRLTNLNKLDISKNEISVLPDELSELKGLKTLIVKGNPLPQGEIDKIQKLLPECNIKN